MQFHDLLTYWLGHRIRSSRPAFKLRWQKHVQRHMYKCVLKIQRLWSLRYSKNLTNDNDFTKFLWSWANQEFCFAYKPLHFNKCKAALIWLILKSIYILKPLTNILANINYECTFHDYQKKKKTNFTYWSNSNMINKHASLVLKRLMTLSVFCWCKHPYCLTIPQQ